MKSNPLRITSSVISFKQDKLEKDLLKYYGPTSFDGTINDNFADEKPVATDKIYESLGSNFYKKK